MATTNSAIQPQKIGHFRAGWELTKGSWRAFKLDKELAWLQLLASVLVITALIIMGVVGALVGNALFGNNGILQDSQSWTQTVAAVAGLLIVTFVLLFIQNVFSGAVIFGATNRFNGGNPTVKSSLAGSWRRWQPLALFSMMMATVGVVLQLLEEKLPFFGIIATRLVGAAWEIANFFAVPVIVLSTEKVAPLTATRESVGIIRKVWGEGIVMQLGVGLIGFLAIVGYGLVAGGIVALSAVAGLTPVAIGFGALGIIGFFALLLLFSTFTAIVKAALYFYATTGKSPALFSAELLEQTARPKRKR